MFLEHRDIYFRNGTVPGKMGQLGIQVYRIGSTLNIDCFITVHLLDLFIVFQLVH